MLALLNINKSSGSTSREVVNRVQRLVRPVKVGHAGTLDPLATGVLVVCLGRATRLVEYVQRMAKSYRGTFLLGHRSDTEDVEGDVTALTAAPVPSRREILAALPSFVGQIDQQPPRYSALKVKGQRSYALARAGQRVTLASRPIEIHDLQLVDYDYPSLTLDICCGSGTYIRSLGRDIAECLGTSAVMSALQRTAIGPFSLDTAIGVDELNRENLASLSLPALLAVADLRRVALNEDELAALAHGTQLADRFGLDPADEVAGVDGNGELVAVLERREGPLLRPKRNFIGG